LAVNVIAAVSEPSQVGGARRSAAEFARQAGAADAVIARIALVATEMATNLIKHASGGQILIDWFGDADGRGVELLSLDKGPGIADVGRAVADGYTTSGSSGTGLGAISRQADRWAIFSRLGFGTAMMARFCMAAGAGGWPGVQLGVVTLPYPGEQVCGDGWVFADANAGRTLLVVDGSGHGALAQKAAEIAVATFTDHQNDDCATLVERMHRALAPTRGAALAVARIDAGAGVVRFVGVGNITGALLSNGEMRRMVSHNGTVGHIAPRIREFTYPFAGDAVVILHSDGLSAKWNLADYPGLATSHPSLIAGILFRDYRRDRDDASIVVLRAS
jgi:anti-sigma regulatory factor (Ser/Thr protein kinase)